MFPTLAFVVEEFEVEAFEITKFELLPKRFVMFAEIKFAKLAMKLLAKRLVELELVIVALFAVNSLPEKFELEIFSKLEFVPDRDVMVAFVSVAFPEFISAEEIFAVARLDVPVAFKFDVLKEFSCAVLPVEVWKFS
jgi:hypothetical protein